MKGNKGQSQAGAVRQHLSWIEEQLEIGIKQEAIVSNLAEKGVEISLKNLRNELWRARKKRASVEISKPFHKHSSELKVDLIAESDEPVRIGSHNPEDLNKIMNTKPDMAGLSKLGKKKK